MMHPLMPVTIAASIVAVILTIPTLIPTKKTPAYDDEALRKLALSRGLAPVPNDTQTLLSLLDSADNPISKEKIALGKQLFFDPILSQNRDISCASCHLIDQGGDDNRPTAIGHENQANPFHLNSPTVLNAALSKFQFWDGRATSVEEQAAGPIQASFEMHMTPKEVEERLNEDETYIKTFQEVFDKPPAFSLVQKAIGAYERTLLTRGAFDLFLEGDNEAISKEAKKGLSNFINFGCKGCHTGMALGGQSMQRFPLRKTASIYDLRPNINLTPFKIQDDRFPFENVGEFLGKENNQYFRVPILRNITKTAPYFHNGAIKDLNETVRLMGAHQLGKQLKQEEISSIIAFLKTLEGNIVDYDLTDN